MRRITYVLLAVFSLIGAMSAFAATANADEPTGFARSGAPGGDVQNQLPAMLAPITITQNTDPATIATGNSVACGDTGGTYTTQNSYYRRFDLDGAHGITDTLTLENFTFGVESASGDFDVVIHAYSLTGTFTLANLTEISSSTVTVSADDSGALVTVPISGTIDPSLDLVMEIDVPSGEGNSTLFYIGSNAAGQSAPTYLSAADCGITQPTPTGEIGFPDMHVIMVVGGDVGAPTAVTMGDLAAQPVPNHGWALGLGLLGLASLGLVAMAARRRQ